MSNIITDAQNNPSSEQGRTWVNSSACTVSNICKLPSSQELKRQIVEVPVWVAISTLN